MIYDDPCATAAALRAAYLSLIMGEGAKRVIIEGGGGKRDVTFQEADKAALRAELREAERQCSLLTDPMAKPRRYAIRAGQRTRRPF